MRPFRPLAAMFALALPAVLAAQAPRAGALPTAPGTLTLEQAVELALANTPQVRQAANDQRTAAANVRAAYGSLLPQLSANAGMNWREGRAQVFGGQSIGASSNTIGSNGSLNGSLNVGLDRLAQPSAARAGQRVTEASLADTRNTIRQSVTVGYITAVRSEARVALEDSLVASARLQVELARARVAVGSANQLDVQRAEVALGQQRVRAVQARSQAIADRNTLFQRMGVVPPEGTVVLPNTLTVGELPLTLEQLLAEARRGNTALAVSSSVTEARDQEQRVTKLSYYPQLQLSAGYGGFTNQFTDRGFVVNNALAGKQGPCFQQQSILGIVGQPSDPSLCNAIQLTPAERQAAIDRNATWPFQFTRNPYAVNFSISLPIFDGFTRGQRLQQAEVARDNAREAERRDRIAVETNTRSVHALLVAAREAAAIAVENATTARAALTLAEARYRAGAATFLDVATARDDFARAETDRINTVAVFAEQLANLEALVGRRLR